MAGNGCWATHALVEKKNLVLFGEQELCACRQNPGGVNGAVLRSPEMSQDTRGVASSCQQACHLPVWGTRTRVSAQLLLGTL